MQRTLFGRYHLLERLGSGGMADVYRALPPTGAADMLCAVKRIHPNLIDDPDFVAMFVDEARLAARLDHPNVARVLDVGRVGADYFIALEHVHGRDLRAVFQQLAARHASMPIDFACEVGVRMCAALHYAHELRDERGRALEIVHRDVSPHNVLVSYDGDVKMIDFGIARAADRTQQTQAGFVKGKYAYMSPEQLLGRVADRRSDVFATGIVLWELITGQRLFHSGDTLKTVRRVREAVVPPPSVLNALVSPALEKVLLKALAREPAARYQTAAELGTALAEVLAREIGLARSADAPATRLGGWMRTLFAEAFDDEVRRLMLYLRRRTTTPAASDSPDDAMVTGELEVSLLFDAGDLASAAANPAAFAGGAPASETQPMTGPPPPQPYPSSPPPHPHAPPPHPHAPPPHAHAPPPPHTTLQGIPYQAPIQQLAGAAYAATYGDVAVIHDGPPKRTLAGWVAPASLRGPGAPMVLPANVRIDIADRARGSDEEAQLVTLEMARRSAGELQHILRTAADGPPPAAPSAAALPTLAMNIGVQPIAIGSASGSASGSAPASASPSAATPPKRRQRTARIERRGFWTPGRALVAAAIAGLLAGFAYVAFAAAHPAEASAVGIDGAAAVGVTSPSADSP